jgi:hypothetical protein
MSNFGPAQFGPAVFGGEPVPHLFLQIDAEMTPLARRYTARGHTDGTSLHIDDFTVGRGGFDPLDYLAAIPVNPDAYNVVGADVLLSGPVQRIEWANGRSISCYCLLEAADMPAGGYLGEIGIFASIQNSPGGLEDGVQILFAAGNFPLLMKSALAAGSSSRVALRVVITT